MGVAPRGIRSFISAMQVWLKKKLFLKSEIKNQLKSLQKELDAQQRKLEELLQIEATLMDKSRSNQQ